MLNFKHKLGVVFLLASILAATSLPMHQQTYASTTETQNVYHSYIVGFDQQIDESLIRNLGGTIEARLESIHAVSAQLTIEAAQTLAVSPSIRFIEEDKPVKHEQQEINPYLLDLNFPKATDSQTSSYYTGKGIKIGVLDTGIDTEHTDLKVAGGVSFVPGITSYDDDNGHGTHVAGIIAAQDNTFGIKGLAYNADLYAIKVLDSEGSGQHSQVIDGIEWAVQNGMDIVNLSLAGEEGSYALKLAVDSAYNKGLYIIAASGNHPENTFSEDQFVYYPAKYESVIAVGAVDYKFTHPAFSGAGPELEFVAPGVNIYSTFMNNTYQYHSGTSMATPYVTAIYALYKEAFPNLTTVELRAKIQKNAKDLGAPGRDVNFGYGLIQAPSVTAAAAQSYPDVPLTKWYAKYVYDLTAIHAVGGYPDGKFYPEKQITRGEVVSMIGRALQIDATPRTTDFPDVKSSYFASGYIATLSEMGLASGFPDGTFKPTQTITRGEVIALLDRAYALKNLANAPKVFPDIKTGFYAYESVQRFSSASIANGYTDGTFRPGNPVTRSEMAVFLSRTIEESQ